MKNARCGRNAPHVFHRVSATVLCGGYPEWDRPADKSPKGAFFIINKSEHVPSLRSSRHVVPRQVSAGGGQMGGS